MADFQGTMLGMDYGYGDDIDQKMLRKLMAESARGAQADANDQGAPVNQAAYVEGHRPQIEAAGPAPPAGERGNVGAQLYRGFMSAGAAPAPAPALHTNFDIGSGTVGVDTPAWRNHITTVNRLGYVPRSSRLGAGGLIQPSAAQLARESGGLASIAGEQGGPMPMPSSGTSPSETGGRRVIQTPHGAMVWDVRSDGTGYWRWVGLPPEEKAGVAGVPPAPGGNTNGQVGVPDTKYVSGAPPQMPAVPEAVPGMRWDPDRRAYFPIESPAPDFAQIPRNFPGSAGAPTAPPMAGPAPHTPETVPGMRWDPSMRAYVPESMSDSERFPPLPGQPATGNEEAPNIWTPPRQAWRAIRSGLEAVFPALTSPGNQPAPTPSGTGRGWAFRRPAAPATAPVGTPPAIATIAGEQGGAVETPVSAEDERRVRFGPPAGDPRLQVNASRNVPVEHFGEGTGPVPAAPSDQAIMEGGGAGPEMQPPRSVEELRALMGPTLAGAPAIQSLAGEQAEAVAPTGGPPLLPAPGPREAPTGAVLQTPNAIRSGDRGQVLRMPPEPRTITTTGRTVAEEPMAPDQSRLASLTRALDAYEAVTNPGRRGTRPSYTTEEQRLHRQILAPQNVRRVLEPMITGAQSPADLVPAEALLARLVGTGLMGGGRGMSPHTQQLQGLITSRRHELTTQQEAAATQGRFTAAHEQSASQFAAQQGNTATDRGDRLAESRRQHALEFEKAVEEMAAHDPAYQFGGDDPLGPDGKPIKETPEQRDTRIQSVRQGIRDRIRQRMLTGAGQAGGQAPAPTAQAGEVQRAVQFLQKPRLPAAERQKAIEFLRARGYDERGNPL